MIKTLIHTPPPEVLSWRNNCLKSFDVLAEIKYVNKINIKD